MNRERVINLAWEIFKIRISSSKEGSAEDDGMHKMTIEGILSYNHEVIEKWYKASLATAEIIVALEEAYLHAAPSVKP